MLEKAEKSVISVLETMEQNLEETLEEDSTGGGQQLSSDPPPEPVVTENVTVTKTESVLQEATDEGTPQVTKEVINMKSEKSSELKVRTFQK